MLASLRPCSQKMYHKIVESIISNLPSVVQLLQEVLKQLEFVAEVEDTQRRKQRLSSYVTNASSAAMHLLNSLGSTQSATRYYQRENSSESSTWDMDIKGHLYVWRELLYPLLWNQKIPCIYQASKICQPSVFCSFALPWAAIKLKSWTQACLLATLDYITD